MKHVLEARSGPRVRCELTETCVTIDLYPRPRPLLARDSWGEAYDKHAMSLPKPGFTINYRRDEMQVPIGRSLIFHSYGQPAQRARPLLHFANPGASDAMKRAKVNCLTGTKTQ